MALFNRHYHPAGTPPGTLAKTRPANALPLRIRLIDYDSGQIDIRDDVTVDQCKPYLESESVTWIHVAGHPSAEALVDLGAPFGLHSLALEDVINSGQRPKVEPFSDQLFVVMSLPVLTDDVVEMHQVSLFLGSNYLISFCAADFAPFEPIVRRLQSASGRIRSRGADYLLYSLLDVVVDSAFPLFETLGLQLEDLEEQVLEFADHEHLAQIHQIRRELILVRRNLWPQREVINQLMRGDIPLIRTDTHIYLRDCYDHAIQIMDLLETYRDMVGSLLEIYLSSVNNRMNDVMRVLTVIATIFIPLTFIVGIYGMNFDRSAGPLSMPELSQPLGYLVVWIVMVVVAVGMVLFFRSRRWF